jgi:putative transposase
VTLMCEALEVSRSGYYASIGRKPCNRAREDAVLVAEIQDIHRASRGTYGSPRVLVDLQARDFQVGRHRVARLMRENGITARFKRPFRRTTDSKHSLSVAENHLARNFAVDRPDKAWVTDITYLWTREGWLYLAVVLDLFSRRVIGWSMAEHLRTELVLRALRMALGQRAPGPDLTHHSDHGCQYASEAYRDVLDAHGIQCSMSRKGDCWDNAVVESFFGTLKTELVHRTRWLTRLAARTAVFEYIEVFYNRQRRHSYLGYLSPVDYERLHKLHREKAA